MLQRNIANRYASALFALARDRGKLESIEADFPKVAAMIRDDADLNSFITHPAITTAEKIKLVSDMFKGKVDDTLYDMLCLTVDKRREAYIPLICDVFMDLLLEHRNRQEAEVETPYELPEDIIKALSAKLESITGKSIVIRQVVEPELLGGIRIRLGDRVVDGSIVHRLRRMKETLQTIRV